MVANAAVERPAALRGEHAAVADRRRIEAVCAQRKARELRERADELIERGKDVASKQKESISAAVEGAREAYRREAGKA